MAESTVDFEFDFGGAMRDLASGQLVKPVLQSYLFDAKFPAFDLHFDKQEMERAPDNFFHPSTHPNLPERVLYEYLAHPDTFPVEKKQYMGTLSVTIGKVMHEFIQMCLTDAGIMPAEMQVCSMCPPKANCHEAGFLDADLGERGHVDGLLDLSQLGPHVPAEKTHPIFEFKTSHDNFGKLSSIEDLDLATFKKKWPDYYGQQQRYQKMSGLRMSVVLFMETMYPWTMREFHVPYDYEFNARIDAKYQRVRQAVADHQPPICCGLLGCPAKNLCRLR